MEKLLVIDLFAGTGSSTAAFREAGHRVVTFELDGTFAPDHQVNVLDLDPRWILAKYGRPDFLWASPPCTAFSVASIGHHWHNGGPHPTPKTDAAVHNQLLVQKARDIAETLAPRYGFIIENPRGMLRKLPPVQGLERRTVTYCQYGDTRMKPTDLWGTVPGWEPQPPCKNGDPCHEAAPRGSRTGTQGLEGAKERSRVPYGLGLEVLNAIDNARRLRSTDHGTGHKAVLCLTCGTTIRSEHRHDFKQCACPEDSPTAVYVDGGTDYFRMGHGDQAKYEITEKQ